MKSSGKTFIAWRKANFFCLREYIAAPFVPAKISSIGIISYRKSIASGLLPDATTNLPPSAVNFLTARIFSSHMQPSGVCVGRTQLFSLTESVPSKSLQIITSDKFMFFSAP